MGDEAGAGARLTTAVHVRRRSASALQGAQGGRRARFSPHGSVRIGSAPTRGGHWAAATRWLSRLGDDRMGNAASPPGDVAWMLLLDGAGGSSRPALAFRYLRTAFAIRRMAADSGRFLALGLSPAMRRDHALSAQHRQARWPPPWACDALPLLARTSRLRSAAHVG
jgi:hypothetical protein